ncbi:MAG: cation:proton antiporter, partial [Dehalococcoidia bacterium]|nr:cation:proton antiporter [Dehalococcoidia bacterium]
MALLFAFGCGFAATRVGLPAVVGYLVAGVIVGPFTPGFVADRDLAPQLAEIGVILLMFGVGIHFSLRELLVMRKVAVPGAIVQSATATALAVLVTSYWGWDFRAGLVLGFAVSVASTVVLLRALIDRNLIDSAQGRIAVGWLVVEDLFTVIALVFLPVLAAGEPTSLGSLAGTIALTLAKVTVLVVGTVFIGARVVPWALVQVSRTGSRELFTLSVLAVAFGVAFGSAEVFGVSMALGAFLGGLVVGESELSHRAAEEALPMRDAFAVLFFVSVGMLFDPSLLAQAPLQLVAIVAIIVIAKPIAAFAFVAVLGHPTRTGLVVAAGLAQIGEFSFILAELGDDLDLITPEAHGLILAAAIVSITLNPLLFAMIEPLEAWFRRRLETRRGAPEVVEGGDADGVPPAGHVILCGYGRVGRLVAAALEHQRVPYVVVEQDRDTVDKLRTSGIPVVQGDAAERALQEGVLHLEGARLLVLAIPDPIATRQIADSARH